MKTNQNGFAAVLAVLIAAVVLIGAGGYFYATKTAKPISAPVTQNETVVEPATQASAQTAASDTSGWQTYRSDEWGMEIKYPETIYQKDNWCDKKTAECFISFEETKNKGQVLDWPSITIGSVTTALSPRAWIEKNQPNIRQIENQKTPLSDIKVGAGQTPGVEFASSAAAGGSESIIIQGSNNNLLEISLNASPNGEIAPAIFDQMLSTFKLVESSASNKDETYYWKPYENQKYGFSFKYPPDWIFDNSGNDWDFHLSNMNLNSDSLGCEKGFVGLEIQIHSKKAGADLKCGEERASGKKENIKIGQNQGYKIEHGGWDASCDGAGYCLALGDTAYVWVFTGADSSVGYETINKIIGSIKHN